MSTPASPTSAEDLGEYTDALKADRYAKATLAWTGPIIVFGWIIVVIAGIVFVLTLIATILTLVGGGSDSGFVIGAALGATAAAALVSLVLLLQAAVVLAIAYYLRMRAQWTRFEVGRALAS